MVRLHRSSSNHCDEGESMIRNQVLSEFGVVRVSSVWFDYTEPYRTTVIKGEEGYREVSSALGVVRPHRTSSNLCDASGSMATGQNRMTSWRFDRTESPRTTVMQGEAWLQRRFE